MSTIIYRALDDNHDPVNGQGQSNFLVDLDAVAQAILTRLLLFRGEWWENLNEGLPLWQDILGRPANLAKLNLVIQQRIAQTPYVVGVGNVQSAYDATTRKFKFACTVQTTFGQLVITNEPTPPPRGVS